MNAISMIELSSIAKGVFVTDYVGKSSEVTILRSHSICPGKFIILFTGSVANVENSLNVASKMGENFIVNTIFIPNIHKEVIDAINGVTKNEYKKDAIGVMEYFSVASAISGADIAVKSADISLFRVHLGYAIGGKSYVTLMGNISSVEEAVKKGTSQAKKKGLLVDSAVIASPIDELYSAIL